MDNSRIEDAIKELLEAMGENPKSNELSKTSKRAGLIFGSIAKSKNADISQVLKPNHELNHDEMVLIKNIPFYSFCEHHLLPFFGKCHVAYIPQKNKIVGIGRITEAVSLMSRKLQVQERLTTEIAESMMKHIKPKGVGVIIEARHLCMEMESGQSETKVVTSAVRGIFRKDVKTRKEFLNLAR